MHQLAAMPQRATGAPDVTWDGYYINLDRSPDRRARIEEQLQKFGLGDRYRRFPAVDGRTLSRQSPRGPGEVGIFRSHLDAIRLVAVSSRPAHIVEDDVVFCDLTASAIEAAIRRDVLGQFDILFLETFVGETIAGIRTYHEAFRHAMRGGPIERAEQLQILDLTAGYQSGATSYLITPDRAAALAAALEKEWDRGPTAPVDTLIRDEARAGRLRIGCIFPFVTAVDIESSWVSHADRRELSGRPMLELLLRHTFFVRRDISGYAAPLLDRVLAALPPLETGEAMDLYARIVRYYLAGAQTDNGAVRRS